MGYLHDAAAGVDPLTDADQPQTGAPGRRNRPGGTGLRCAVARRGLVGVGELEGQVGGVGHTGEPNPPGRAVPQRVGETFPDDGGGHAEQFGWHLGERLVEVDAQPQRPGFADERPDRVLRFAVAGGADHPGCLGQHLAAPAPDAAERLAGAGRVAVEQVVGEVGLHHHRGQGMRQVVVQILGDPQPLRDGSGLLGPFAQQSLAFGVRGLQRRAPERDAQGHPARPRSEVHDQAEQHVGTEAGQVNKGQIHRGHRRDHPAQAEPHSAGVLAGGEAGQGGRQQPGGGVQEGGPTAQQGARRGDRRDGDRHPLRVAASQDEQSRGQQVCAEPAVAGDSEFGHGAGGETRRQQRVAPADGCVVRAHRSPRPGQTLRRPGRAGVKPGVDDGHTRAGRGGGVRGRRVNARRNP